MQPRIVIYKPGYEPLSPGRFTERRGFQSFEELRRALRHGAVIRLPKLPIEQDRTRARQSGVAFGLGDLGLALSMPPERVPVLLHLINSERRRYGLEPYSEPTGGDDS